MENKKQEFIGTLLTELLCDLLREARVNPYNFKHEIGEICVKAQHMEEARIKLALTSGTIAGLKSCQEENFGNMSADDYIKTHYNV